MSTPVKRGLLLCGLLMYYGSALSQSQDSLRMYDLDPVVVSAGRIEEPLKDVPRNVTVISRQQLERGNYLHLGDVLQREAGLMIVGAMQTPGSQQSVFLRGANANQTAVLINGIRITDPSTPNGVIDLNEVSLSDVERIEIVRGGQSTLYGNSGVGGTINIITDRSVKQGTQVDASVMAGTFGQSSSLTQLNGRFKQGFSSGWSFTAFGRHMSVQGLDATLDTLSDQSVFRTRDQDDFSKTDFGAGLAKSSEAFDFQLMYRGTRQEAAIDQGAFRDHDNATLSFRRDYWQADATWFRSENHQMKAIGGYTFSNRLNVQDSATISAAGATDQTYFRGNYDGSLLTAELQSTWEADRFRILTGLGLYGEIMKFDTYFFSDGPWGAFEQTVNYDSIDTDIRQYYGFAHLSWKPSGIAGFGLTAGGRVTQHSQAGLIGSFEFNPYWKFSERNMLFFTTSTGFTPPSLYQLFDPNRGFNAFLTRGNPDLRPEQSLNMELGYRFQLGQTGVQMGAFHNRVKDAISYVYLWKKQASVQQLGFADYRGDTYLNLAQQTSYGLEVAAQGNLGSRWSWKGNFTYVEGSFAFSPEDIPSRIAEEHFVQLYDFGSFITEEVKTDELVRRPSLMLNAELRYQSEKGWGAGAFGRWVAARPDVFYQADLGPYGALGTNNVGAFSTLDFYVDKSLGASWNAVLRIENVLNNKFSEINGFATRGRGFFLQLNYSL